MVSHTKTFFPLCSRVTKFAGELDSMFHGVILPLSLQKACNILREYESLQPSKELRNFSCCQQVDIVKKINYLSSRRGTQENDIILARCFRECNWNDDELQLWLELLYCPDNLVTDWLYELSFVPEHFVDFMGKIRQFIFCDSKQGLLFSLQEL